MQYRISTLVALFSATTALAYLDCGGGRAPPKTTVPGCPGYVDPATAVPTSTTSASYSYVYTTTATPDSHSSVYITTRTTTASGSLVTNEPETEVDSNQYYTVYADPDAQIGCNCRGYLCQYATAGCVNLDASSTITANPGWETQSFDPESYYSYIRTASSAGGELSIDGYRIELVTAIPSTSIDGVSSKTQKASTTATAPATGSGSAAGSVTTMTFSTVSASSSQAASNSSSSSNATVSTTGTVVASTNSASTISGMASMAALLISGAVAIVML